MIRKKTVRNGQTKYLYNITATTTMMLIFHLTTEMNCCVVTPRELLTTVGDVVSFGCNARPNNEQRGTISNLKLENEDKSETVIFEPPAYDENGKILNKPFVAEGYFLSKPGQVNATVQVNETQLKHGGRYVCSCTAAKAPTGSGNLVVLDKLSFVLNGGNPQTPEALLDLNCSLSFSGSISSVSVDLTINDANGTELAAERNLSLSRNQGGSHHINYSFIAHQNKEQNFTCEVKAWNHSSSEKPLLPSMTSHYSLNSGHMTTSLHYSWSSVTEATVSVASVVLAVGVALVVLVAVVIVAVVLVINRDKLSTCKSNSSNFVAQKCSASTQRVRYEGEKPSTEHPTEDKKQKKNKTSVDGEVFVIDNAIYDASPQRNEPTDDHKPEQIYNEIC